MNTNEIKEGMKQAEKELQEERVKAVKKIAKKTLEELSRVEKELKELQERKRFLKMDIEDLKEGRLDRIEERQKTDEKAAKASVVRIEKVMTSEMFSNPYEQPYHFGWNTATTPFQFRDNVVYSSNVCDMQIGACVSMTEVITPAIARRETPGAYSINGDNKIVHLR